MMAGLHPGLLYWIGALLVAIAPARVRRPLVVLVPAAALVAVATLPAGIAGEIAVAGRTLVLLRVDAWSRLFGLAFAIIGLLATVYGLPARTRGGGIPGAAHGALPGAGGGLPAESRGPHVAAFAYTGSALGAVFAGDLLTLFIWWELMAVSSTFLILGRGTGAALAAGYRYLLVHACGGTLLLGGIAAHVAAGGDLTFGPLRDSAGAPLILLGFALNAAIPPLHAWLTDAYPEATVGGAVFLSALTTKTAVYALARGFPGEEILVWAGVAMALYGVVFAVLENDIRRLLAYHIVSQVGYMVCGIGLGTPLALAGVAAHAFCHILYKGLLFMGTGSVLAMTGRSKLTELGGIARRMPWTVALYAVGACSISGVPLFNGFVSKSLVLAAAEQAHRPAVEWLLVLASIGTFLHTGLKLPWFTFFGANRGAAATDPPATMRLAMAATAALCIAIGVMPGLLYRLLPFPVDYAPYTWAHVLTSIQLLAGTAIGFAWLLDKLGGERTITLDADWFYRRGGRLIAASARALVTATAAGTTATERTLARTLARMLWADRCPAFGARIGPWVATALVLLAGLVALLAAARRG
jgi:multicomponent Na+:H+ antiporter subunit D